MPDGRLIKTSGGLAIGPQGGVVIAGTSSQRCGCCGLAPCPGSLTGTLVNDRAYISVYWDVNDAQRFQIAYSVGGGLQPSMLAFSYMGQCSPILANQGACADRGTLGTWGTGGQVVIEETCSSLPTYAGALHLTFTGIFLGCDCLIVNQFTRTFVREINGANRVYAVPFVGQFGNLRQWQLWASPIPVAANTETYQ